MKAKALLLAILVMASLNSYATPAKKETLEELFRLTDMTKMLDAVYAQTDAMMKQSMRGRTLTEAQKPVVDKFAEKSVALMKEELSWDKLKPPVMAAYASVYTDKEVKDIIKFYQTPTGKKLIKKMPELTQVTMGLVQKSVQGILPKLKVLQEEMAAELEKNSPQGEAKEVLKQ
ncbi:MAG: DUF2059 domain-containing protein [Burkholderiales bacterium]|nr:DUF2059 domain-containing protein [Burkholderiales bacterium]